MSIWRRTVIPIWRDTEGRTCQQALVTQANAAAAAGGAQAVLDAMAAMSSAAMQAYKVSQVLIGSAVPSTGIYPSVADKAVFLLRSSVGTTGRVSVPAPVSTIFLASTDRVDLTNALVIALLSAIYANLSDSNGNPWVTCTQGYRTRVTAGLPLFPPT